MSERLLNEAICLKKYITQEEYKEIIELEEICRKLDKTNLKLELDYRLDRIKNFETGLKEINEFMYYINDVLVAYLNISSFGDSGVGEINGVTHPGFRRKGLFTKLLELAIQECRKRNFYKILLLSDGKSRSGIHFIKASNGEYDFSEYRMKAVNKTIPESEKPVIKLRRAEKTDGKEIARQNSIFFHLSKELEYTPEEEEELIKETYMVELQGQVIGKISIELSDTAAFICGFGIIPEFRGKGYGKAALKEALHIVSQNGINQIELDVEAKNDTALNLYKACGFEEQSVMDYYKYNE